MAKKTTRNSRTSFEEYKEEASRQLSSTTEPKNGGGSMVDFYEALGQLGTKIAKVPLIVSFPQRNSK